MAVVIRSRYSVMVSLSWNISAFPLLKRLSASLGIAKMPSASSKTALRLNVQYLAHFNGAKCCTFWTFTRPDVISPYDAASSWRDLSRDLVRHLGFKGVRVFELHPSGHGLHVHVCAVGYFPIRDVLAIVHRHGWGRTSVERVHSLDCDKIGLYLGKYFTKQKKLWQGVFLKGIRWWGTFGKLKDSVRVKDIKIDSVRSRLYRHVSAFHVAAFYHDSSLISDTRSRRYRWLKFKLVTRLYLNDSAFDDWFFWLSVEPALSSSKSWFEILEECA